MFRMGIDLAWFLTSAPVYQALSVGILLALFWGITSSTKNNSTLVLHRIAGIGAFALFSAVLLVSVVIFLSSAYTTSCW